jgi:hypothetical protein
MIFPPWPVTNDRPWTVVVSPCRYVQLKRTNLVANISMLMLTLLQRGTVKGEDKRELYYNLSRTRHQTR